MAQLSDDCFAFGGVLLTVDAAVAMIASRLGAVDGIEYVGLGEADGRVLATELTAPMALPPFANSAVDGYAVRGEDLPVDTPRRFVLAGRVQAGGACGAVLPAGQAWRIFTGAPMPAGADTVFMQEDVRVAADGAIEAPPGLRRGANMRPAGEDVDLGRVVLPVGRLLRPQDVAVAAALGVTELAVIRRVRVAIFSTGDEIVEPGAARGPSQLFDSNRTMLGAMLRRLGCAVTDLGILADEESAIARVLRDAAAAHDLILTSGGVSTGEADHVRAAVEAVGSLVFWRMAIKPGRPVAMGVIDGTPFIGLPGNPVASFITFVHVARPALAALAGCAWQAPLGVLVRAAFSYRKKAGRREYVRVSLARSDKGATEATKFPREGAGLLSSLVETDGLVELSEQVTGVAPGDQVTFFPYAALL